LGFWPKTRKPGKTPKIGQKRVPQTPKKQKKRDFWQKIPAKKPLKTEITFF
jgi:hypothetical protein